jgi:hypothetical protein
MNTEVNFSEWEFTPVIDKVIAFQLVDGDTELMQQYCPDLQFMRDKQGNVSVVIDGNVFLLLDTWWLVFFQKKPIRILNNINFWKEYVKN